MNTPATLDPSTQTDDLVFRFIGGKKDGESVSISTQCCKLGITRQTPENETVKEQCSIYRGPAGVAVRSEGEVLINGEPKSVHWLKQGDRIQVSGSQAVEIVQLGKVENVSGSPEHVSDVFESSDDVPHDQVAPAGPVAEADRESTQTQSETAIAAAAIAGTVAATVDVAGDRIDFVSNAIQEEYASESGYVSEQSANIPFAALNSVEQNESPAEEFTSAAVGGGSSANEDVKQRFESLENSVGQLHDQAANVDRRFDRLEDSLNALTEHLERLSANTLSSASAASKPAESTAFVTQPAAVVATPVAAEAPKAQTAGDNYENSIASLFSELASDGPGSTPIGQATAQQADEAISQTSRLTEADASQVPALVESVFSEPLDQPVVAHDDSPVTEPVSGVLSSSSSDPEPVTEEPIGGFTERMMASMHDEAPTLSGEAVANLIGLGIPKPEDIEEVEPEAAVRLPRAEVRTESVAEIFSRLSSGAAASEGAGEGAGEEVAAALPLRQTVQTTFEDIEASVSAALGSDVFAEPAVGLEVEPAFDAPSVEQVVAPEQVVAVEQVVAPEPVEPAAPAELPADADDGGSIMDKFRASLEDQGSENEEGAAEQAEATGAVEQAEATGAADDVSQKQDPVDDYMSMLMSRMNGDSAEPDASAATEMNELSDAGSGLLEKKVVEKLLTAEEFTPRQKAAPIKSLDKMRELANSTSRSAVQRSEKALKIERKKSLVLQALALGSLALAALMIWAKSYVFGGAFTVIFFLTSAYFLYATVSPALPNAVAPVKKPTKTSPDPSSDDKGN